ncbi:MAG: CHAT domain-containing tetratricopeptide repeat protein [Rivularia sp. (in: cyanobacteria)]
MNLTKELNDKSGEISASITLAKTYVKQGKFSKAVAIYEQALILVRETDDKSQAGVILGNLAIAYKNLGNYVKAIENNQQSLKIFHQLGNLQNEGIIFRNLGNVYEAVGDYDNAIKSYQKSLEITQEIPDKQGEARNLSSLGQVYANQGKYREAKENFQKSLQISQSVGDIYGEASTLINLGAVYHSTNQLEQAIKSYQKSLKLSQAADNKQVELEAWGSLALAYDDLKNYPQAIEYFEKSLEIAQNINNPKSEALTLNNLGHTLFKAGRLTAAEEKLRQAVKLLDKLRLELNDSYKISIFDTQVYTYNLLQQILVAQNKSEAALEASEQGRTRAFIDLLANKTLKNKENNLPISPNINNPSITRIQEIAKAQNATLVEYTIVPADDIKHRGKLSASAEELYIWVVKPTGKVIFKRVYLKEYTKSFSLEQIITSTREALEIYDNSRGTITITRPLASKLKEIQSLKKLHKILIKPIAEHLPKNPNEKIIFIPQTELFLIPFPALKDSNNKYLIQKHTILTAPSIQSLEFTRKQKQFTVKDNFKSAVIVGNPTMPKIQNQNIKLSPLPYAEKEANEIAEKLLGSQELALITSKATEKEVVKRIPNTSLIHFATHGLLHETRLIAPGPPGAIALASSQEHDGFLTAGEIINMKLKAQLAVLSACDTGRGDITGDGVIGLSRSFIAAGVPSVIVSLWQVNDKSTSELMTEFYRQLLADKKRDKAKALRKAMLKTMEEYPSPRLWAAFTLIGES